MKQKSISKLADRYLNGSASEAESNLADTFLDELRKDSEMQLSPDEEVAKEVLLVQRIHSGMKKRKGLCKLTTSPLSFRLIPFNVKVGKD